MFLILSQRLCTSLLNLFLAQRLLRCFKFKFFFNYYFLIGYCWCIKIDLFLCVDHVSVSLADVQNSSSLLPFGSMGTVISANNFYICFWDRSSSGIIFKMNSERGHLYLASHFKGTTKVSL